MSADTALDRDLRLAARLGQLPSPALPDGFAARIVQNVTRLPQQMSEEPAQAEQPEAIAPPLSPRRWRFLPHAIGTAIAASLVAALLLRGAAEPAPSAPTPVPVPVQQVAQNAPAPLPAPVIDSRPVSNAGTAKVVVAPRKPTVRPADLLKNISSPVPQIAPRTPVEATSPEDQAPMLATPNTPAGPANIPTEQAFVGPPNTDEMGSPILQGAPAQGLGISGSGPITLPSTAPAPAPRGGRGPGGGMNHF